MQPICIHETDSTLDRRYQSRTPEAKIYEGGSGDFDAALRGYGRSAGGIRHHQQLTNEFTIQSPKLRTAVSISNSESSVVRELAFFLKCQSKATSALHLPRVPGEGRLNIESLPRTLVL